MRGDTKWHYQMLGTTTILHDAKDPRLSETSLLRSHSIELHRFRNNAAVYAASRLKPANCSDRPPSQQSCFIKADKCPKVAAFMPSSCHTTQEAGRRRVRKGSLSPALQNPCWRMQCALEMMQLGMQRHQGQPGDRGFIKFHC